MLSSFLPKSGQACSCHRVNTHDAVSYEASVKKIATSIVSLTRNVDTYYQEVYDENPSGHLFPIRSIHLSNKTKKAYQVLVCFNPLANVVFEEWDRFRIGRVIGFVLKKGRKSINIQFK